MIIKTNIPLPCMRNKGVFIALLALFSCSCTSSNVGEPASQLDVEVQNAPRAYMDPDLEKSSEAMHEYLTGQISYERKDFARALEHFKRASDLSLKGVPTLHTMLAELHLRSGDLENALSEARQALEIEPDSTSTLLLYAGVLEALGKMDEAEPIYLRLIESTPTLFDAYILLSSIYNKSDQWDKSIKVLERMRDNSPKEAVALYYLGRTYEDKGDFKNGEKYLRLAMKGEPWNTSLPLELIRVLLKAKKYDEAKEAGKKLLEQDPSNVIGRRLMGELMIGERSYDEALKHLQVLETVENEPNETRFKIGLIQMEKQNFKEAIREFNLVLAQSPEHTRARYYLASAYSASGMTKDAVQELLKIKPGDEMFGESRTFASFLFRQLGDLQGAEDAVRDALEVSKGNESIIAYLVLILREAKKFDDALEIVEEAVKANPDNDKLTFSYAVLLSDVKKTEEALKVMEQVIVLNPKHGDALNFVAYSLAENGSNLDRALELSRKSLEIKPRDGFYMDTLAWIYYQRKDYEEAEKLLAQAVKITAEDLVVLEHYGDCLDKLGRALDAIEIYKQIVDKGLNLEDDDDKKVASRAKDKLDELMKRLSPPQALGAAK